MKLHKGYWIRGGKRTIYEHREIMAEILGRPLGSNELVHHENEIRTDNNPRNLKVMSRSAHMSLHMQKRFATHCKRGHPFEGNA